MIIDSSIDLKNLTKVVGRSMDKIESIFIVFDQKINRKAIRQHTKYIK